MRHWAVLALLCHGLACGSSGEVCRSADDCASGVCGTDGRCAEADDPDAPDASPGPDAEIPLCSPNRDGVIDSTEVPLAPGLGATFRVATDVTVDTAGTEPEAGKRAWSFDQLLDGDRDLELELTDPTGHWWSDDFPTASYASPLSVDSDLLGVFQTSDDALLLLGVVSPEGGVLRTELEYDPPVQVLRFPFQLDDQWVSESTISGLASGVVSYYFEDYQSEVDASGDVATPFGSFDVLRVRTELTRTVGAAVVTSKTQIYVSECFGTVASVVSEDYESEDDFADAAEVRRLSR
jgi:hypothetical protein